MGLGRRAESRVPNFPFTIAPKNSQTGMPNLSLTSNFIIDGFTITFLPRQARLAELFFYVVPFSLYFSHHITQVQVLNFEDIESNYPSLEIGISSIRIK